MKEADVGALTDANEPSSSSDYRIARLSFHPSKGSTEWVQFDFPNAKQIENFGVYWFDEAQGAAYRKNDRKEVLPQSWKLFYWLDNRWQVADANPAMYTVERDQYNFVKLDQADHDRQVENRSEATRRAFRRNTELQDQRRDPIRRRDGVCPIRIWN